MIRYWLSDSPSAICSEPCLAVFWKFPRAFNGFPSVIFYIAAAAAALFFCFWLGAQGGGTTTQGFEPSRYALLAAEVNVSDVSWLVFTVVSILPVTTVLAAPISLFLMLVLQSLSVLGGLAIHSLLMRQSVFGVTLG